MTDSIPSPEQTAAPETEETLLEQARGALSNCNWIVGECAARWTEKYARGRTDADFGNAIGLSADQVFQRRRVWQTFHDVRDAYSGLKWSHFYVAVNWDDAAECLQWAVDNQATIAEMRAWRRSIHGEDLTSDPDEFSLQALDYDNAQVRGTSEARAFSAEDDLPFEPNRPGGEYAGAVGSGAETTPYAPFRKEARGEVAFADEGPESSSVAVRAGAADDVSPLRIVKRAIGGLRRIQQQLGELSDSDYASLSPELVNQLWDVYEELGQEIKHQG